ncbi:hypothetical protein [Pragia fontium]|uniref:Uncharacterized protein n=1 Tax=Pragia fontium DSM 5563 = ATCC 49100 TaxID=1122977 RepID=A0AAJ4W9F3_9GAMM|nr:hypothetical protein [Pragia fontium]SFC48739.1 hypothetical protein SAMN02745723_102487 [Pragia fontium DSM 5563 = ATCC 49100]
MSRAGKSQISTGFINPQYALVMAEPELPLEEFARRQGRTLKSVQQDADKGLLPLVNTGKRTRTVNMVALFMRALEDAQSFLAHRV